MEKEKVTFQALYEKTIQAHGEKKALIYFAPEKRVMTFQMYDQWIDAYAAYFEKTFAHRNKGEWVGLKLPNSPVWFAVLFALLKIGFHVVLIEDGIKDSLLSHFVKQVNLSAIITNTEESVDGVMVVNIGSAPMNANEKPVHVCWSDKIAFCTSGTTGTAKVYVFDAASLLFSCDHIKEYYFGNSGLALRENKDPEKNTSILALPFRHISGFLLVVSFWNMGKCLMLPRGNHILKLIETIREEQIWLLFCVPAMWKAIVRIMKAKWNSCGPEAFQALLGENLKIGMSAAAKLDDEMIQVLSRSGLHVLNCWGMTETGVCSIGTLAESQESGYVGSPMNDHRIQVIQENGCLDSSGIGELMLEGETLFQAMMVDGKEVKRTEPFRTGDVFRYENNKLWFLGRCKNVIVGESGENVYPEEIDAYFDFIADRVTAYCTVGYQEEPAMFLQTCDESEFQQTELFTEIVAANKKLPVIKQLTKLFVVQEKLPYTAKGEVARIKLNEAFVKAANAEMILLKGKKV